MPKKTRLPSEEYVGPDKHAVRVFRRDLLAWFATNRRQLHWRAPGVSNYVKIVSEVLLQRTQAANVSGFLPTFLANYPSWAALAGSTPDQIGEVIKPLGLWRRRALALWSLASEMCRRGGAWPAEREELESIPAVGQYVANAVLLFEHDGRTPLLDASMARLLRRYFSVQPEKADIRYDQPLHQVAAAVLAEGNAVELNWAMLDFATVQCRKQVEACASCPLRKGCQRAHSVPAGDC